MLFRSVETASNLAGGLVMVDLPQEPKEEFEKFEDDSPHDPEEIIDVGI